ncbi:MAG: hypothetical protein IKW04_02955 [Clostridia bacterium]|nr:hypothetical protein [Clostridia bacterium]
MKQAKIIVLSGQSNGAGVGYVDCLPRCFSKEKIEEYRSGYSNIKLNYISYDCFSDGFVTTKIDKETIGPELGIAEYLSEQYPNEEFFIVKFAVGSASLRHDFLPPKRGAFSEIYKKDELKENHLQMYFPFRKGEPTQAGWCYRGLISLLHHSIDALKEEGYAPKIIGFCWMQGESDACLVEHVENYEPDFDAFIGDFQAEFSPYLKDCIYADAGISEIWPCYEQMNFLKKEYADTHRNFRYIDTISHGLTTRFEPAEEPDIYHYDCESVIKLGNLFVKELMP